MIVQVFEMYAFDCSSDDYEEGNLKFRKMLENEMDVWFRARGLLLIGEPIENVEAILKEEIGADADGDGMLS